jgi:hypothetical protein
VLAAERLLSSCIRSAATASKRPLTIGARPPRANGSQQQPARRHWTFPARNRKARIRRWLHGAMESLVCRFAIHGDRPVFAAGQFGWIGAVEANWQQVRRELDAVMAYREAMPNFQDILREVGSIQKDDNWKTFFLKGVGMNCSENARRCPETMRVLATIPGCTTAFFSILSPGKHIPPLRGAWAGVLRLHLALMMPEPP